VKIDGLNFDLLEENFPPDIHRDPKSKIDHYQTGGMPKFDLNEPQISQVNTDFSN
jgi:hypothetical protein